MKKILKIAFTLLAVFIIFHSTYACTVFILTDGKHTYFFNNEDFTNTKTRIWFVPKGKGYYGSAYVGFNDGEAQGGFNTKGLAFEWVTVNTDSYVVDPAYVPQKNMPRLEGNSSQWMLEQCKTVDEAIKFYQTYSEPAFARSTLVIADKSGASVIIGSKDGKIYFDNTRTCRALGFGEKIFENLYQPATTIQQQEGPGILQKCLVPGAGGTKYSNSYNLKTGDITYYNFANPNENVTINLNDELKKGSHYYESSKIFAQVKEPVRPLALNMNRHILFINKPLVNQAPEFTARIQDMFSTIEAGILKYDAFTENFAGDLRKAEANYKSVYAKFGKLKSLSLIYKGKEDDFDDYSYIIKFDNVTILWQFLVNDQNKIHDFNTLSVAWIK
jgi:hypothetical protein